LYFDAKDESVPKRFRGIGIRLEEDILITDSGAEILSARIPVSRSDVEALI
jgi:Xaa-Pro aminopeptidase